MNYQDFESNLGTWGLDMKQFIESPHCDEIYRYLARRFREGRKVLPYWEDTFRAFKETPKEDLKCIFFPQDPYPWQKNGKNVADGIAMSCRNTGQLQPSLSAFYEGLEKNLPEYRKEKRNPDLTYLCNQGVMLLNTSLTVELNRPNCHSQVRINDKKVRIWEPFMRHFLEEVISKKKGLVLVFCGKESQYYEKYVNPLQHYIIKVEHPAAASHAEREWKHEKVFSKINYILETNKVSPINWK